MARLCKVTDSAGIISHLYFNEFYNVDDTTKTINNNFYPVDGRLLSRIPKTQTFLWVKQSDYTEEEIADLNQYRERFVNNGYKNSYILEEGRTLTLPNGNYFKAEVALTGSQQIGLYRSDDTLLTTIARVGGSNAFFSWTIGINHDDNDQFVSVNAQYNAESGYWENTLTTIGNTRQTAMDSFFSGSITDVENPEQGDDISENQSGAGYEYTHDWSSDDLHDIGISTISALNSGFLNCYKVTQSELNLLHTFMWTDSNFLQKLTATNSKVVDAIISLQVLPFSVETLGSDNIYAGTINTGVEAPLVVRQYQTFDCGTVQLPQFYQNFLDYAPHADITITLPFVGERQLDINQVSGKTIGVKYIFDILSSGCICVVYVDGEPLYTFNGAVNSQIPMTAQDSSRQAQAAISAIQGVFGGVGSVAQGALTSGMRGGAVGGAIGAVGGGVTAGLSVMSDIAQSNAPAEIRKGGNLSSAVNLNGIRYPFVTIISPRQAYADEQNTQKGGRLRRSGLVGDFSGYLECDISHLNGITCTASERNEISQALSAGVII